MPVPRPGDFDHQAFFAAIEDRKQAEGLSWTGVADAVWAMSSELNAVRDDHPVSVSTIRKMGQGSSTAHGLFVLRWLGEPPEAFLPDPREETVGVPLPETDSAHRLRWNLPRLYAVLEAGRESRGLTWAETAHQLGCTPSQLTGLRTAKFTTGMTLAMRITQAAHRPAAEFIRSTRA